MISDTLADALHDIDYYLFSGDFDHVYDGSTREQILALRKEIERVLTLLDFPDSLTKQRR